MSSGTSSQGSSKRGSYSSRSSRGGGRFKWSRHSLSGYSGQKSGHWWRPSQQTMSMRSSSFQRPQAGDSTRVACGACDHYHSGPCKMSNRCFYCGQIGHFRRECPYLFRGSTSTSEFDYRASGSGFRPQQSSGFRGQSSQADQRGASLSGAQSASGGRKGGRRCRPLTQGRVFAMTQQDA